MEKFITSIPLGDCKIEAINIYNILNETGAQSEAKHNHSFFELHFIRSGVSRLMIDEAFYEIREKQIIIIPKGSYHYAVEQDEEKRFTAFQFDFTRGNRSNSSKKKEYDYFISIFDNGKPLIITLNRVLESIYNEIITLQGKYDIYTINKMHIKIAEFFLEIANVVDKKKKILGEFEKSKYSEEATRKEIIDNMFVLQLKSTLEEFAQAVYLSSRQFERFCKKAYGKPFKKILLEKRMLRSRQLINEGSHSLAEIATQVGFSTYGAFLAAYKNYYGKNPSQSKK